MQTDPADYTTTLVADTVTHDTCIHHYCSNMNSSGHIMDSRSLCGIYGLYVILSCINPVCQDELASTSHIILLRHASNELQIIEHMYAQQ
jgi:hypothetical protein